MNYKEPNRRQHHLGLLTLLTVTLLTVTLLTVGCVPPPNASSPALNMPSPVTSVPNDGRCTPGPNASQCERSVSLARSETAKRALTYAFDQIGKPYSTAGRLGPDGYDCSGFIWRSYFEAGIDIGANISSSIITPGGPRVSVPMDSVLPGDVVWHPGHVAIALADGNILEAAKPGTRVRIVSAKYREFVGAVAISAP